MSDGDGANAAHRVGGCELKVVVDSPDEPPAVGDWDVQLSTDGVLVSSTFASSVRLSPLSTAPLRRPCSCRQLVGNQLRGTTQVASPCGAAGVTSLVGRRRAMRAQHRRRRPVPPRSVARGCSLSGGSRPRGSQGARPLSVLGGLARRHALLPMGREAAAWRESGELQASTPRASHHGHRHARGAPRWE